MEKKLKMVVIENKDPHPKRKNQKFDNDKLQNSLYSVFIIKKQKDKNALSFLKGLKNCYSFKVKVVILR